MFFGRLCLTTGLHLERLMSIMDIVTPSINTLLKTMDSRYALVVLAAKRARQLMVDESLLKSDENMRSGKSVTNALEEIAEGKITFKCSNQFSV